MAIIKRSKNMTIKVSADYVLRVEKKLEKVADQVNIEAAHNNLTLACNKKIVGRGNKT
ncbi:hypothetical protein OQX61_10565 [Pedobacter sp. PLR]|uniref:hypothetical protein n=1 Tax=Pedobacter sp. PLR TaxID=2994465 RepID=UPI0022467BC5|nr:hypothetical protein [Pedobacter sp. PLR]MCX2451703.1 hypothetical protein [Pedobacter sp. PLR]